MVEFTREVHIAERIAVVDGISGSAKSLLMTVLASFNKMESPRIEHIYEYLCALSHFRKIEKDAANVLIRIYADLAIHDNMISREINFRPKDDSSVFKMQHSVRYLRRLLMSDGRGVLDRIQKEKPILNIVTHQVLGVSELLFSAFKQRVRIVEMVRHPLYVLEHWVNQDWGERYGNDPKDFTFWLNQDGQAVPWWANGWEEKYLSLKPIDRVIRSVDTITRLAEQRYGNMNDAEKKQVLFVPFEHFVTDPLPWISKLEEFIGTERGAKIDKILKKQRCPREILSGALDRLREEYLKENPEEESLAILDSLSKRYEKVYDKIG